MTVSRFLNKGSFYVQKALIGILVYVNHRLYMKYYNSILKRHGLILTGTPRFIAKSARFDDLNLITLGDRVVISMNVMFLTHDYSSTTAFIALNELPPTDVGVVRGITVGNNVFVGMNSILLPGVAIDDNVIIGAGSVVRGHIPSFSIVVGNPAKVVGDVRDFGNKVRSRSAQTFRVDKN